MSKPLKFFEMDMSAKDRIPVWSAQLYYSALDEERIEHLQAIMPSNQLNVGMYIIDSSTGYHALGNLHIEHGEGLIGLEKAVTSFHHLLELGVITETPEYIEFVITSSRISAEEELLRYKQLALNNIVNYFALRHPKNPIHSREIGVLANIRRDFDSLETKEFFDKFADNEPLGPVYDGKRCFLDLDCWRNHDGTMDDYLNRTAISLAKQIIHMERLENRDEKGRTLMYDSVKERYIETFLPRLGDVALIFSKYDAKGSIFALSLPLTQEISIPNEEVGVPGFEWKVNLRPFYSEGRNFLELGVFGCSPSDYNQAMQVCINSSLRLAAEQAKIVDHKAFRDSLL